jgi:putative transposase
MRQSVKRLIRLRLPLHDRTLAVTNGDRICIGRRKFNLSTVLADRYVGSKEISDQCAC